MLERFRHWYMANAKEITWFIIGAMIMSGLIYLGQQQYLNAAISFAIAWANWYFSNR